MVFAIFGSLLQLILLVRALRVSLAERFVAGWVGGVLRLAVMVATGAVIVSRSRIAFLVPATAVLGPVVSFGVLWLAHRRRVAVPAAQEERLGRPFGVWLPVALFDAVFVAINVFLNVMADPF